MAKINAIETKVQNEMSVEFAGITEKDKEISLLAELFKKIYGAEFSLSQEFSLSFNLKFDSDDIPLLKVKAVLKEKNVHSDQLQLFDFTSKAAITGLTMESVKNN